MTDEVPDDYVAWCTYQHHEDGTTTISTCDSDAKGAFKVYRVRPSEPSRTGCVDGKPMMHGPKPYRWCATHDDLMLRCETFTPSEVDVEAALRELREMFPHGPAEVSFGTDNLIRINVWPTQLATVQKRFIGLSQEEAMSKVREFAKGDDN